MVGVKVGAVAPVVTAGVGVTGVTVAVAMA